MGVFKGKRKLGRRLSSYVKKTTYYQTKDPTRSPLRKRVFVLNYSPIVSSTPASSVKKQKNTPKKTPQKSSSKRKLSFTTGPFDDTLPFSPLKSEADLQYFDPYFTDTQADDSGDLKYVQNLLPRVLQELGRVGKSDTFVKFLELVNERKFPLNNIAFSLFCDVVSWYSLSDTRSMRYSEDTIQFFWVGLKLFGGRFVRFMTGMKNESAMLTGRDSLDPKESKINFACPSETILREVNPFGETLPAKYKPGFLDEVMELKSVKDDGLNSYVIMFDGKKVKRGGDVDLLGFEDSDSMTLQERKAEKDLSLKTLNEAVCIIETAQKETNLIQNTSTELKEKVSKALLGLVILFSLTLQTLRSMKLKKELSLRKLTEKAGEGDWRKSTYAHAIDACKTNIYKIENTTTNALQVQKSVCKSAASLNMAEHLFADTDNVDLQCQANLRLLKEPSQIQENVDMLDTSVTKQRTDKWLSDRKDVKVTGSTIYKAIGCESLKKQKEHYDQVMNGIEPPAPTSEQEKFMKHGTDSEVHEIATMCSIVMPVLFPDCVFHEEGYYVRDDVLVSPDGSLRLNDSEGAEYAFEGKAPFPNPFTKPVHYQVPERYIPQTLFEQRVLKSRCGTIYMSWTEESCTVFKVLPNEPLCQNILDEIHTVYFKESKTRPKTITPAVKELKHVMSDTSARCMFLGEFPSVKGFMPQAMDCSDKESPYFVQKETPRSVSKMTYDDVLKHLLLGKDILNETYELQRPVASQVIVYLLADLDRLWKMEEPHAVPVSFFFRGYSLSMEVMRRITKECKQRCQSKGLDVVVCAADGEFSQLMVRGNSGNPLTQYQLSKDVWNEVCKLTKLEIVSRFETHCVPIITVEQNEQTLKTVVVETVNHEMGRIKTPKRGWRTTKENQSSHKGQDENLDLNVENDTEVNQTQNYQTVISADVEILDENQITPGELDDTMPYDVQEMELVEGDNSESSQVSYGPSIICTSEIKRVLITANSKKWENVSEYKLKEHCSSAKSLQTFTVKELSEITKIVGSRLGKRLKTYGMKKAELINQLSDTIADGSRLEVTPTRVKSKSVCSLKTLAGRVIKKKEYPKQVLNIAYANFVWPDRVKQWHESASVNETVTIVGLENTLVPYYVPDKDPKTGDFELFVYDKTHLGSNLRKTICLDKIEGISKGAWVRVAQCKPLILNPAIIDVTEEGKILDQMKEKLTRTMLSEEVEETMIANGDTIEANFCAITRGALYEAEDIPGIPAVERCRKRLRLIEWLKSGVDFGDFPPYGAKIKGMSSILYEGLRSSNEGKLYLYALAKKGTYCARAPNTLCSETFFGSMQEMDPWGQGVLSTTGVEKHMSDFITVTAMRMDQNR